MGALIFIVIVLVIVFGAAKASPGNQYDTLVAKGIPARGILLQVAATGTKAGPASRRFEMRQVYIDVEIPGQQPYETSATVAIPLNLVRDVLPGATVELRVHARDNSKIAIVGPGTGFVQQALRTA